MQKLSHECKIFQTFLLHLNMLLNYNNPYNNTSYQILTMNIDYFRHVIKS